MHQRVQSARFAARRRQPSPKLTDEEFNFTAFRGIFYAMAIMIPFYGFIAYLIVT